MANKELHELVTTGTLQMHQFILLLPDEHHFECSSWVEVFSILSQSEDVWKEEVPGNDHNLNLKYNFLKLWCKTKN